MAMLRRSYSIDEKLAAQMEALSERHGYKNRSEFLRDLIRDRLVQEEWAADREGLATLTLVYEHEARQLGPRLTSLQHHHHELVLASTHVHLSARLCAEMIMLRGRVGAIRDLADQLMRQKGVLHARLAPSSPGDLLL